MIDTVATLFSKCIMLQIEQEMALILEATDVRTEFLEKWNTVYVPAILSYGRNTQSVLYILSTMDESGRSLYVCTTTCIYAFMITCM